MTNFTASSRNNPCPICNRNTDGDCRISTALVLCHKGSSHQQPEWVQKVGDHGIAADGQDWAYVGPTADGRALTFKPHREKEKPARPVGRREWVYASRTGEPLIRVCRTDDGQGNKKIYQERLKGTGRGVPDLLSDVVPYRYQDALQALSQGAPFVVWAEGEPCVDALWAVGIPAVTSIGGTTGFRPKRDKGLLPAERVVIAPDRDQKGVDYGRRVAAAYPGARWLLCFPDQPSMWNGCCPTDGGLDVVDWIAAGATKEVIISAISSDGPAFGQPATNNGTTDAELTFTQLVEIALQAVRDGDTDMEMAVRSQLMSRFRRTDGQVNAALLKLLTQQESTGKKVPVTHGLKPIDLGMIDSMEWLLDGFIYKNDMGILDGSSGAGKTLAALGISFAVIDGNGFLDRSGGIGEADRRVLFIASDSGAIPLRRGMEILGVIDHPAVESDSPRFHAIAHSKNQAAMAWEASVAGCIHLLKFVKDEKVDLVVIDSCKAVMSKADLSYTDNLVVTALLTFFKEVVCQHCSVLWINHDGTEKGATAGAKAWREIPSIVHSIERVMQERDESGRFSQSAPRDDVRSWLVRKTRDGNGGRSFIYTFDHDQGELVVAGDTEIVGNCGAAVISVLTAAYRNGIESLSRQEIIDQVLDKHKQSQKTVDNSLGALSSGRAPVIVKPSRGRYALSPRRKQGIDHAKRNGTGATTAAQPGGPGASSGQAQGGGEGGHPADPPLTVPPQREVIAEKPLYDYSLSITRRFPDGNLSGTSDFPTGTHRELIGNSQTPVPDCDLPQVLPGGGGYPSGDPLPMPDQPPTPTPSGPPWLPLAQALRADGLAPHTIALRLETAGFPNLSGRAVKHALDKAESAA